LDCYCDSTLLTVLICWLRTFPLFIAWLLRCSLLLLPCWLPITFLDHLSLLHITVIYYLVVIVILVHLFGYSQLCHLPWLFIYIVCLVITFTVHHLLTLFDHCLLDCSLIDLLLLLIGYLLCCCEFAHCYIGLLLDFGLFTFWRYLLFPFVVVTVVLLCGYCAVIICIPSIIIVWIISVWLWILWVIVLIVDSDYCGWNSLPWIYCQPCFRPYYLFMTVITIVVIYYLVIIVIYLHFVFITQLVRIHYYIVIHYIVIYWLLLIPDPFTLLLYGLFDPIIVLLG